MISSSIFRDTPAFSIALKMSILYGSSGPLDSLNSAVFEAHGLGRPKKKHFIRWIKHNLPKGERLEEGDRVMRLFKAAFLNKIRRQVHSSLSFHQLLLSDLCTSEKEDSLQTIDSIILREIELLAEWELNPSLVITAEKGERAFQEQANSLADLLSIFDEEDLCFS